MHPYQYGIPSTRQPKFSHSNLNNMMYYPQTFQNRTQNILFYPNIHHPFIQHGPFINTKESFPISQRLNSTNHYGFSLQQTPNQTFYNAKQSRMQNTCQNNLFYSDVSQYNLSLNRYPQSNNFHQKHLRQTCHLPNSSLPFNFSNRNFSNLELNHNKRNSINQSKYHRDYLEQIPYLQANLETHKQFLRYLSQFYTQNGQKKYNLSHENYLTSLFKNKNSLHIQLLSHLNSNYRLLSSSLKNSIQKMICQKYPSNLDYVTEYKKVKQIYSKKTSSFIKITNQIVSFTKTFQTKQQFQWNINKLCLCLHLLNQNIKTNITQTQLQMKEICQELQILLNILIQNQQCLTYFFQDECLYLKVSVVIFQCISIFSFDKLGESFDIKCQPNILKNIEDLISLYVLKQIDICQNLRLHCIKLIKQCLRNRNSQGENSNLLSLTQKKLFNYTLNKMIILKMIKRSSSENSSRSILKQLLFYIQMTDLLQKDTNFQKQSIYVLKKRFMDHVCNKKKQQF